MIRAIFAADKLDGLGFRGTLPWPHNKHDLAWFKSCTDGDVVVMGRKTWDDPKMPKPLPNRINIVVTNRPDVKRATYATTLEKLPKILEAYKQDKWIIGGSSLFNNTKHLCEEIWISRIAGSYYCDVKLENYKDDFYLWQVHRYNDLDLTIEKWKRL